jgi:hypothetical protein
MNSDDGLSIEELEKKAENADFSDVEGTADDSIGGSMSVESLRLPDDIIRAFELVGSQKRLGRTSVMRMALVEWLNEHSPDVLDEVEKQDTVAT